MGVPCRSGFLKTNYQREGAAFSKSMQTVRKLTAGPDTDVMLAT